MTQLYIIYEIEGKEKEVAACEKTNKPIDGLNFIYNMKLNERKRNSWMRENE